jgi:2-methylcitrate dehydratase PrpD
LGGLSTFAAGLSLPSVPAAVRHQATLCILDTIGCMVLGAETPDAALMLAAEQATAGADEAAVFGTKVRLPAEAAARTNGYFGDIFELNDLIGGHASIGVVSAALGLAEVLGSSGADLLKAAIAGIETTARVHAGFRDTVRPYAEIGTAYIGFVNTLGAAAAAASLLHLDEARTVQALAIAGALAGWCPAEAIFRDGGTAKPILFGGWPAAVGIRGARYAEHGMTGPERLLDGDFGYYASVTNNCNPDGVRGLDGKWHIAEPRRKLHACCGFFHTPIDLAAELRRTKGSVIFNGAEIRITMTPRVIAAISKGGPPKTPNQARFHAEYCVALAAAGADVILPEHSTRCAEFLADPKIAAIMHGVRIAPDPALRHYGSCVVEVVSGGRTVARATGAGPKGSPANPMSDAEVIAKFQRLVAHKLTPDAAAAYTSRIQNLEKETDCRWLAAAFV